MKNIQPLEQKHTSTNKKKKSKSSAKPKQPYLYTAPVKSTNTPFVTAFNSLWSPKSYVLDVKKKKKKKNKITFKKAV